MQGKGNIRQSGEKNRISRTLFFPDWTREERAAFKPPEQLSVAQWADRFRVLGNASSEPGRWHTERTPYLKEIMEKWTDSNINELVLCFGTQLGKTETINNCIGYCIDQEPGPGILIYPTEKLAKNISKNRIRALIGLSEVLRTKFIPDMSEIMELHFDNMVLNLVGANSAADLASKPMKYVWFDEVDKFPAIASNDADPRLLAKERLKAHPDHKIMEVSSPTYEEGNIWSDFMATDVRKEFYIPCPNCGKYISLSFKQIIWPEELENKKQLVRDQAKYYCQECGGEIKDYEKRELMRRGKWKATNVPEGRVRSIGYHLSSLYSPWLTWGDIAYAFLSNKDVPSKLKGFINGWLAEPWKLMHDTQQTTDTSFARHEWKRGMIPPDTQRLCMSVDVQKTHFWYEIRAWNNRQQGRLIDFGQVIDWDELEDIIERREFRDTEGRGYYIDRCLIDSGFRTDDVYDFCSQHAEICMPCKGASKAMPIPYKINNVDKKRDAIGGLPLITFDPDYWKDFTHSRQIREATENGSMSVFADCPDEYIIQQKAEVKKIEQDLKTGRVTEKWVPVSEHIANHLLDTCVMNAVAADYEGVRYFQEQENVEEVPESRKTPWISGGEW